MAKEDTLLQPGLMGRATMKLLPSVPALEQASDTATGQDTESATSTPALSTK